jgi:hypothetical protein
MHETLTALKWVCSYYGILVPQERKGNSSGQAQALGTGNGKTAYSVTVRYTSSFTAGVQEGIVVVYMYSQADGSIATAAMQKAMLGRTPVALRI